MPNKFSKLQQQIEKDFNYPIRLKGYRKSKTDTDITIFLYNFFTKYNNKYQTVEIINSKKISLHTQATKRRSLGDLYMICKYYFPDATLDEVIKELVINLPKIKGFRSSYCHLVRKRMFYLNIHAYQAIYDKSMSDEYKHRYAWYYNEKS